MMPGRFITLEGGEGTGKSTQARLLCAALQARGLGVLLTREPGGTPGAELIRTLLLDAGNDWTPAAEALLFAAARADHVAKAIRPALAAGQWVICDRFIDSTRAYQGGADGLPDDDLMELHRIGSAGLLPDCTLMLEVPEAEAAQRLALRDGDASDRIGGRPLAFHSAVTARFRGFAAAETRRFVAIAAAGDPQVVHHRVLAALAPLLGAGA